MMFSKRLTTNKAVELTLFEKAWSCVVDLKIDWTIGRTHDHAGFLLCFVIFGYKIIEFNFYDTRHGVD